MIRSIVGAFAILAVSEIASAQNLLWLKPIKEVKDVPIAITPGSNVDLTRVVNGQLHSKESAIEARIEMCVEYGGEMEMCRCRAETSAEILDEDDFVEETWHLQRDNQTGLRDFQNRMLAEQRDRMFQLGEALYDCPASLMRLE